jgi:hypothetical protein
MKTRFLARLVCQIRSVYVFVLVLLSGACNLTFEEPISGVPERSMNVTEGPELVFERAVAEILPQLSTASPTGANGRVGNELVFWGYRLQDDRQINLFACAKLPDVDCEERIRLICPATGEELFRQEEAGKVRHLNCHLVGKAGVGDLLPNCEDQEKSNDLLIGLMQCG